MASWAEYKTINLEEGWQVQLAGDGVYVGFDFDY